MLGFEFESKILPFSVSKLYKTLMIFAFINIASLITERTHFIITGVITCIIACIALGAMYFFPYKEESKGLVDD